MSLDDNLKKAFVHERDYWKARKIFKQFIKELKDRIDDIGGSDSRIIDELAGEGLI